MSIIAVACLETTVLNLLQRNEFLRNYTNGIFLNPQDLNIVKPPFIYFSFSKGKMVKTKQINSSLLCYQYILTFEVKVIVKDKVHKKIFSISDVVRKILTQNVNNIKSTQYTILGSMLDNFQILRESSHNFDLTTMSMIYNVSIKSDVLAQ